LSCDRFEALAVRPHKKRLYHSKAADAGDKLASSASAPCLRTFTGRV
jgi:hypothetical protein